MSRSGLAPLLAAILAAFAGAQSRLGFDTQRQCVVGFGTSVGAWDANFDWRVFGYSGTGGPPQTVFDPVGSRVIALYGGYGLAEWKGAQWRHLGAAPFQTPYLCWDEARNRLVAVDEVGSVAMMWEWDGQTFYGPIPAPGIWPGPMVFDPALQQVLTLHPTTGGNHDVVVTSAWNGSTWTTAALGDGPRGTPMLMAGDLGRRTVVCQAGNSTWEWNGTTWTRSPNQDPDADLSLGLVYHRGLGLVLRMTWQTVGGFVDAWTGGQWTRIVAPRSPWWSNVASAYDPVRDQFLIFGGDLLRGTVRTVSAETWAWTGADWHLFAPAALPPARNGHSMAWHGATQRVVLFGGSDGAGILLGDTWTWNGSNWSPAATGPAPRRSAAFTTDVTNGTCILFGGTGANGVDLADTWEWNGATWLARQPTTSPPARNGSQMAHDASRARTVLAGGTASGVPCADLWEWDGQTWLQRQPASSPRPRHRP
jgi:hypothetical protein